MEELDPKIEPTTPQEAVIPEPKKRSYLKWVLVVVTILLLALAVYAYFKISNKPAQKTSAKQSPSPSATVEATTASLVHVTYPSTTPPGAQNSSDMPVGTADGHYLELNGKGVLTLDGKAVTTNSHIHDAVLSQNGLHYAYLMTPTGDPTTSASAVYIDGNQISSVTNSTLVGVSNDGKSFADVEETSKVTPTSYNTGIHQEVIQLNDSQALATSDYGFLGEQFSGDLKNVLANSRNYGAGSTYYFNQQKLNNCSYTWSGNTPDAPQFGATLSQDGLHTLCYVYHLESPPAGHGLTYQMKDLQVFEDDSSVLNITTPILADQITQTGYATKGEWMLMAEYNIITPKGVTGMASVFPSLTQTDLSTSTMTLAKLAYLSPTKYVVYLPSSQKLANKGVTMSSTPNVSGFSMFQVLGLEFSSDTHTVFIYDTK